MKAKHTLWSAIGVSLLGLGLAGCPSSANDASDVTFTPTPFSGTGGAVATGGFVASGGVVGTTGGAVATGGFVTSGGVVGTTGGFATSGGVVGTTGGVIGTTGGVVGTTGGVVGTTGGFTATGGMAAETGGMAAETGGSVSAGSVSKATFTVTTKPQGGRYAPRHVMAIWIEDASGNFVKTLAKHAGQRANHLNAYNGNAAASLPFLTFPNLADAVTSATLTRHEQHVVTWNLTDNDGNAVPAGNYSVHFELTDRDTAGKTIAVDFSTANGPGTSNPTDDQYYVGMSIVLE